MERTKERTIYTVNVRDTDHRQRWMDCPAVLDYRAGAQDSGCCRFTVATNDPDVLETALGADDDVLEYEEVDYEVDE